MKLNSRSLFLAVALGLTAGCAALAAPAMAQTVDTQANPLADFQTKNNDPFSSQSDASSSMMNLMQRVMQGDRPDAATFAAAQQENLNDAMANFRAKQLQLLKAKQAQALSPNLTVVPVKTQPSVKTDVCAGMLVPSGMVCMVEPKTGLPVGVSNEVAATCALMRQPIGASCLDGVKTTPLPLQAMPIK